MDADITVIGAGVVGLAISAELADGKNTVYIIERHSTFGRGISSRNSEVIHAGIYYPPGSLKASLCVEGRNLLYETCDRHNIPHRKTGKLIIASTEDEEAEIGRLYENAVNNGLSAVRIIDGANMRRMEPNIRAVFGLHSPDTGIINVHALMDHYRYRSAQSGAEFVPGTEVIGIDKMGAGYRLSTINSRGELFAFTTARVVNAAGLQSDAIAGMIGMDYTLHYCKGDYFSIVNAKAGTVSRLVYPVPERDHAGLGVHLTLDLGGRMKLGPDATYIARNEDYRVDAAKAEEFYRAAVKFLPFIRREDIIPDMSGIRPKLQGPGEGFRDFVISEDLPGFINLVGIESPGLTAAPAIARYVKGMIRGTA